MADNNYRSFTGEIKLMKKSNEFIYDIELWLLSDITNRNNWRYTALEAHKDSFCGTPILCAYVGNKTGDGHNFRMVKDKETGEEYASFMDATAERIVGSMSDNPDDIRIENVDGVEWIVGKGFLWSWYARELVNKIENDSENGHDMSLSIETLVTKCHMEEDVEVEDEYTVLGTTILGDGVAPAVADARVVALQEIASEFEQLKIRAASYINKSEEGEERMEEPGTETTNKPQDLKKQRRVGMKALSKKQLAELGTKFNEYKVLAGGIDDNGVAHICLMSADGTTAIYDTDNIDGSVIVPEKIQRVNAQVCYEVGEEDIRVDSAEATDELIAQITTLSSNLNKANEENASLKADIEVMKANEKTRRLSAAKAKAIETLNRFNENREDKVSEDVLTKINADIENGAYTECEDCECQWVGEEKVEEAVLAACAMKVMEMDKVSAQKNNSQYVWNSVGNKPENLDGVEGLLAAYDIH